MKKLNINAALYAVFCRDANGDLWQILGGIHGIEARQVPDSKDMSEHGWFALLHSRGLNVRQFNQLHRALKHTRAAEWWRSTLGTHGVQLLSESVFYRKISLRSDPVSLKPPAKDAKRTTISVTSTTVHYTRNSISLEGDTDETALFGLQLMKEVDKIFKLRPRFELRRAYVSPQGARRTIELIFDTPRPPLNQIRKYLQDTFK